MTEAPSFRVRVAVRTVAGNRYAQNQDAVLVGQSVLQKDMQRAVAFEQSARCMVGVADGVAAGPCAALAARTVLRSSGRLHAEGMALDGRLVRLVQAQLSEAGQRRCHGMASTLAALAVERGKLALVGVGDSRIYRFRDSQLVQMTTDHTSRAALEAESGDIGADLTGSAWDSLESCLIADYQEESFALSAGRHAVRDGDIWLLCTDGLTGFVSDEAITRTLSSKLRLGTQCDRLVKAALAQPDNDDNISVVLVRIEVSAAGRANGGDAT